MRTEVLNTSLDSKKNLKYLSHSYLKLSPIKKKQNQITYYVTDLPDRFQILGNRFFNQTIDKVQLVHI